MHYLFHKVNKLVHVSIDPFHHDHINTPRKHPLITPFELQMVGGCRMKTGGGYNPLGGLDKSLVDKLARRHVTYVIGSTLSCKI